jgi:hypothetical protein
MHGWAAELNSVCNVSWVVVFYSAGSAARTNHFINVLTFDKCLFSNMHCDWASVAHVSSSLHEK